MSESTKTQKATKSTKTEKVEAAPVVVAAPVVEDKKSKKTKTEKVEAAPVVVAAPVVEDKKSKKTKQEEVKVDTKSTKTTKSKTSKASKQEDAEENDPRKRYFHCVYKNADGEVVRAGRYSGKKPKQAARKALSRVVDKNELQIGQKITFLIKECTRGRKKKSYSYEGSRVLLDKPVEVSIKKKDGTSAKLLYKHDNVVKKVALTECADLLDVEFNDEEENVQEAGSKNVKVVKKAKATSSKSADTKSTASKKTSKSSTKSVTKGSTKSAKVAAKPVAKPAAKATKSKSK